MAFALTILLLSCSFVGCASDSELEISESEISDIESEDVREETNEPSTITLEDCEERGGTWIEEREECSFDSDRPEEETERPEEENGPIAVPPCNVTATEGLNPTTNPSLWPEIEAGQWLVIDGLTDVSYASIELDNESKLSSMNALITNVDIHILSKFQPDITPVMNTLFSYIFTANY